MDDSCSGTTCRQTQLANFCSAEQDEHFGIQFQNPGLFYIGIDDGNSGGGAYLLDALRPVCDATRREHGEACDGETGCSSDCLQILDSSSGTEQGFNFNFFEANLISLGGSGTGDLEIDGNIGGFSGCEYPDVYAVDVRAGQTLTVESERTTNTDCVPTSELGMELQDAQGNRPSGAVTTNGDSCFEISRSFPSDGRAFVVLRDARGSTNLALPYKLKVGVN